MTEAVLGILEIYIQSDPLGVYKMTVYLFSICLKVNA